MAFSEAFLVEVRNKLGVAADADGPTIMAALDRRLHELAYPPAPAPATPAPVEQPGASGGHSDVVAWAVSTGRISPARAEFWAAQVADEKAHNGSTAQTERTLHSLHPVYDAAQGRPALSASATPLSDDLDRQMFGPTQAERERAEDLAAEAELAEVVERERAEAAAAGLTDAEEQALFGTRSNQEES